MLFLSTLIGGKLNGVATDRGETLLWSEWPGTIHQLTGTSGRPSTVRLCYVMSFLPGRRRCPPWKREGLQS